MNRFFRPFGLFLMISFFITRSDAQVFQDGKLYLNEEGDEYVKFTLLNQVWLRHADYNPGSAIFNYSENGGFDMGIRRFRLQFMAKLSERVFLYSQFGMNNFSFLSERKADFFVHDALGEYALIKDKLSFGAGLTAWNNYSRFSAPSIGSILGVVTPLYQQATGDVTYQFIRRLTVYAKGILGKVDYHISLAKPMAIQNASGWDDTIGPEANFSGKPPKLQTTFYTRYQFAENESMLTPFSAGTYLGNKEVFNIGFGFIHQKDAMWYSESNATDTLEADMLHIAVDIYYDKPIGEGGQALSLYGNYTRFDFGPDYIRNQGVMNPANGTTNTGLINGPGNSFPALGTGSVIYVQGGYKFRDDLMGTNTLMPYASVQYANYDRLNDSMVYTDIGLNWLIDGHHSKFTLAYRSRPLFDLEGNYTGRRGAAILQYQVYFY
ncbi:MAG: hypothetical protein P8X57_01830 [Cyclobacteriaceae bacterium]